ncbi:MAG: hypothetical protein V3V49_06885 [Candidatus Krumholzibacteria bacterium]
MTNVKVLVFALGVLAIVGASFAGAQTPYVAVFSDISPSGDGLNEALIPPGVLGQVDSLFLVAYNLNCLVTGIDVRVNYPAAIIWIADIDTQPVTIGTTPTGMSMGWAIPQNGFEGVNIATVIFQWDITSCGGNRRDLEIGVVGHPLFATPLEPAYACFQQVPLSAAVGLTALICATVPVEESTWGKVKALYTR